MSFYCNVMRDSIYKNKFKIFRNNLKNMHFNNISLLKIVFNSPQKNKNKTPWFILSFSNDGTIGSQVWSYLEDFSKMERNWKAKQQRRGWIINMLHHLLCYEQFHHKRLKITTFPFQTQKLHSESHNFNYTTSTISTRWVNS